MHSQSGAGHRDDLVPDTRPSPAAWLLIWPIRAYQLGISRFTPATCRFYPTCSNYAIGALRTHGAAKGLLLTAWRLLRCHPWTSGGIDHVPPRGAWPRRGGSAGGPPRISASAEDTVIPEKTRSGEAATRISGRTAA
jgi:putative membrane protein insertion efficiency factor